MLGQKWRMGIVSEMSREELRRLTVETDDSYTIRRRTSYRLTEFDWEEEPEDAGVQC